MKLKKILKKQYRCVMRFIPNKLAMRIDYFRGYKKVLNLKNPKTFGEKIQWIKLYGNIERYSNLVDKYEVRKVITNLIGDEYLPKLYGVYENADEIKFENLPERFVLKCNHGCGYNIICNNKNALDIEETKIKLNKWLKIDFSKEAKEIQYKNIKPLITCEEYLEDKSVALMDYKYFCFSGKPEFIEVISERGTEAKANFYDLEWNRINLKSKLKNSSVNFEKPKRLKEMTNLATKLSKDYPFVRVDFYNIEGRIVFGELTFTPGGGVSKFSPIEKDYEIANKIELSKYN